MKGINLNAKIEFGIEKLKFWLRIRNRAFSAKMVYPDLHKLFAPQV